MKIHSPTFDTDGPIPEACAFGVMDREQHVRFGSNRNPELCWSDVPPGTRSLVLLCVDSDVPTSPEDVNQEDREVPASLERGNFYHWVMVDIDPGISRIAEGACADAVTEGGKSTPPGPSGTRQGLNDYTGWFANDEQMGGDYLGYDGPCPPWNDSLIHHYHFRLHATDLERCPVSGNFDGPAVEKAIAGHVLATASLTGTYTLNPRLAR